MQFIEELTLVHKVAILATIGLVMVLLLVSARSRKAAAAPSDASAAPVAKTSRRRHRAKSERPLPRRKRRKLAVEAAHSMGVDTPAVAPVVPEVPHVHIPEPAEAAALEPYADAVIEAAVAVPLHVEAVAAAVSDDPYLHDAAPGDAGVFVAQPGWPSPGELASSFDPDAFDPLPEVHEPQAEEVVDDAPQAVDYDDTHALDLTDLSTTNEATALEEIEEWADTVGAESTWDDADESDLSSDTWTIAEELQAEVAIADAGPMDVEDVWSEPDDEPLWNQPAPTAPIDLDIVDLETALNDDPTFDVVDADASVAVHVDDASFDMLPSAWVDGSPSAWNAADAPERPAPPTGPPTWTGGIGGQSSPVVLDLAGLAASGQSLELVIESTADGHGVRLRFGAPAATTAELPMIPTAVCDDTVPARGDDAEGVATSDAAFEATTVDDSGSESTIADVPFLAGVAPVRESPEVVAPALFALPAASVVATEPEQIVVQTHDLVDTGVPDDLESLSSEPTVRHADQTATAPFDASAFGQSGEIAWDAEPAAPATAVMDPSDDPARILADIRARLAALDARR